MADNPLETQQGRAFMREAEIAGASLASGLGGLAAATHLEKGILVKAFFDLSVGFERTMKLIYIIDYGLRHGGVLPTNSIMRTLGHDLDRLSSEVNEIREALVVEGVTFLWPAPDAETATRIISVLSRFARSTRYYNLDLLSGAQNLGDDPIDAWSSEVHRHLMSGYPARRQQQDRALAQGLEEAMGSMSIIRFEGMDGSRIESIEDEVLEERRVEWLQQRAKFHTATMVRDLMQVLMALTDRCGPGDLLELPVLREAFGTFYVEDSVLRRRRTFAR